MSTTRVDYDLVVQELSKTLHPNTMGLTTPLWLQEYRTIRIGAPRQSGLTDLAGNLILGCEGETLYLSYNFRLYKDTVDRFVKKGIKAKDVFFFYENAELLRNQNLEKRFSQVIVDDSGVYFNHYKYSKFFKAISPFVTDDVVIYFLR